jgi:hypothetical protein
MIALPIAAAAIVASLHAQVDSTARIRGQATSSFDGRPIAGVMISAPEAHKSVVTDSRGTFGLAGLPAGPQKIRVSFSDRETEEFVFQLESGRPKQIAVLLDVDAADLSPVVVEVQHPSKWRDLAGFYARMKTYRGFGKFFTRETIQRSRPLHISSLLAREGIMQICMQGCLPTRFLEGVPCVVPVSVDGLAFRELDYDLIPITSVAGVEVYPGTPPSGLSDMTDSNTPNSVWQAGRYNSRGSCGSVMIWTR